MHCEICGRARRVMFFDLVERTCFPDQPLRHSLTLCQGCAEGVRARAGQSEGLYSLSVAPAHSPSLTTA